MNKEYIYTLVSVVQLVVVCCVVSVSVNTCKGNLDREIRYTRSEIKKDVAEWFLANEKDEQRIFKSTLDEIKQLKKEMWDGIIALEKDILELSKRNDIDFTTVVDNQKTGEENQRARQDDLHGWLKTINNNVIR